MRSSNQKYLVLFTLIRCLINVQKRSIFYKIFWVFNDIFIQDDFMIILLKVIKHFPIRDFDFLYCWRFSVFAFTQVWMHSTIFLHKVLRSRLDFLLSFQKDVLDLILVVITVFKSCDIKNNECYTSKQDHYCK